MASVNHILHEMQEVFVHHTRALASPSGFCQRTSLLSASAWVQGLVFGWLSNPDASLSALARSIAVAGCPVSPQAVQQRFGPASATLLRGVLEALTCDALSEVARTALTRPQRTWLEQFPALWLRDSTRIELPAVWQEPFPASGNHLGVGASLKVSVQWEWHSGSLAPLHLGPGRQHDQKAAQQQDTRAAIQGHRTRPGEMHVFDLGYFNLRWMSQLHAQNAYFCCRYKGATHAKGSGQEPEANGAWPCVSQRLEALPASQEQVEWPLVIGHAAQVPVRLVAFRVAPSVASGRRALLQARCRRKRQRLSESRLALCDWNVYLTNAPQELLRAEQVRVLYGLRWQIERLFRLWKETLHLDCWRSKNPHRILCEVYAKLIGALLTQKLTAFAAWSDPARSLVKCAHSISQHALALLIHLQDDTALKRTLRALQRACLCAAKLDSRKTKPATFQCIQQVQNP